MDENGNANGMKGGCLVSSICVEGYNREFSELLGCDRNVESGNEICKFLTSIGKNMSKMKWFVVSVTLLGILSLWIFLAWLLVSKGQYFLLISNLEGNNGLLSSLGQFGDMFGVINSIISAVALFGVMLAFISLHQSEKDSCKQQNQRLKEMEDREQTHLDWISMMAGMVSQLAAQVEAINMQTSTLAQGLERSLGQNLLKMQLEAAQRQLDHLRSSEGKFNGKPQLRSLKQAIEASEALVGELSARMSGQ